MSAHSESLQLPDRHGPADSDQHAEFWEGKNVAILGLGNAALEVSDAAAPFANFVHIYTHSGGPPTVSWESHYVGSIRGIRASHLDGYLLKSLDVIDLPASYIVDPVSRCFRLTPLQNCLFTPDLQWQFRGKWRILQGCKLVQTGNTWR
jgi:hypothetical protein